MEKKTLTAREIRQGKFLLRAPLLAIPLLTLLFWGVGGGKLHASDGRPIAKGFDMLLPAAHVPQIAGMNKMGYYEKAQRDSAAARQRARMEAGYAKVLGLGAPDSLAHEVRARLDQVKHALAIQPVAPPPPPTPHVLTHPNTDLSRLEKVMTALQHNDAGDTELAGLTAALEKLTALQQPHRDTVQRRTLSRPAFIIKTLPGPDDSLGVSDTLPRFDSSILEAVTSEEQILVSGGELKLQLTHDILIDGHRIPAGTSFYGTVSLTGERLKVTISGITWQDRVFPVQLQVDDEDGLPGIYIPGAPLGDATRESMSGEIGTVGPTVLSTGLAGQAANAGMSLARSLIGKKIRPVRVTVPAGYHVLLHPKTEA